MNNWKYKTTNDFLPNLDFHDCRVRKIEDEINAIFIDLEFVYVLPDHPLNPYKVAKLTDSCRLSFIGVTESNGEIHFDNGTEKQVLLTELDKMEFLEFKEKPDNNSFIFEVFGTDWKTHQFCSFKVLAKKFTLEWNQFTKDAWYVSE
jgi:hypothetical protein